MNTLENQLFAVSAVDGRYRSKVEELAPLTSEAGLIANRIRVEAAWLLHLDECPEIHGDLNLPASIKPVLAELVTGPSQEAFISVKDYEKTTNHDVKAVEYYLRDVLKNHGCDDQQLAFIHFACTSEDINNLSYALMLKDCRDQVLLPYMDRIIDDLKAKAKQTASLPMLSRTHGQTASPTTLGKEFAVFGHRLLKQRQSLAAVELEGKMSGAVGNYNAHISAYPSVDWHQLSRSFIEERLGLKQNPLTTQIENHDSMIAFTDLVKHFNTILIGFARDMWSYISIGYFKQQTKAGEVGSSTMPHKVNPIDFENAEGNLGIANGIASHLSDKLLISRWQRDLSDSTVQRVLGTLFGHALIAYKSTLKGLDKVLVNEERLREDLDQAWEVLAEPVQTVMRRYGIADAYERLKAATRGRPVDRDAIQSMIRDCQEIPVQAKQDLLALTPATYLGIAESLTLEFVNG
ncbi:adenylosuccinate lyase [Pseudobacteriovorax antillogorgiicola]|uniref:Adenylosuccinate lyase n=1 Tax=Pseudobacteriovorax antillogorgiicola TaxID=1513793 RepID=A0A1Y6BQQ9_9BACT|nr:adenylosuccinate lyase [Pseudobacteriovorax antillogorgiicola]TCS53786.1 adenylosuccinate lyase [Pseudobacteriovorax antillogorgiicola]SMF22262.1 Adenylosuccinate lyase [Pseudobacteriovorax antillogorgiicola]